MWRGEEQGEKGRRGEGSEKSGDGWRMEGLEEREVTMSAGVRAQGIKLDLNLHDPLYVQTA